MVFSTHLASSLLRDTMAWETLCGRTPLSMLNSLFSGHPAERFGPRTLVLHPSWFIFGGDLVFIVWEVVQEWEATFSPWRPLFSRQPVFLLGSWSPWFLSHICWSPTVPLACIQLEDHQMGRPTNFFGIQPFELVGQPREVVGRPPKLVSLPPSALSL